MLYTPHIFLYLVHEFTIHFSCPGSPGSAALRVSRKESLASRVALKSANPPEGSATPEPEKEEEATALTFRGTFSVFDDL